jgi:hypothetical protein
MQRALYETSFSNRQTIYTDNLSNKEGSYDHSNSAINNGPVFTRRSKYRINEKMIKKIETLSKSQFRKLKMNYFEDNQLCDQIFKIKEESLEKKVNATS